MKLLVLSYKEAWRHARSASGHATDGGFPAQMEAIADLFDSTVVAVPVRGDRDRPGEIPLEGRNLSVRPLTVPRGKGRMRKLLFPLWLLRNLPRLLSSFRRCDVVHTPVPSDIGTIGMLMCAWFRKPLIVRHCGNWANQRTAAERFWRRFMIRHAGGHNVMLATGGGEDLPVLGVSRLRWIFSTSLTARQLKACARERTLPEGRPIRLIIVGRQESAKGTGLVISALPLLAERGLEVEFHVVGEGSSLNDFRELATSLKVDDCVTFHGRLDRQKVLEQLDAADVFCFPTWSSEGFPKALLEALACGLPAVSSTVSVIPQLLKSGAGEVINEPTPEAVAAGVTKVLASADTYSRMSSAAVEAAGGYTIEAWKDFLAAELMTALPGSYSRPAPVELEAAAQR